MGQIDDDQVFEVERIIGRRISLAKKTEYLVFWKGYDIDECSWESSRDTDCSEVVADFERRCVELRKAWLKDRESIPHRDLYENDGLATLIDEAVTQIYPNRSPFQDIVDFAFSINADESLRVTEDSAKSASRTKLTATHGWNRQIDRGSVYPSARIQAIRGTIRDSAGRVFYLTQWSDKVLTWESPRVFTNDMAVLERLETTRFLKERKELVKQYRALKNAAGEPVLSPRKPRFLLEQKPGSAASAAAKIFPVRATSTLSADGLSSTLLNLQSSNLLAAQTKPLPTLPPTPTPKPKPQSHVPLSRPLVFDSSDDEADSDVVMESVKEPYVYIDHSAGSAYRRYQKNKKIARRLARERQAPSEDDGDIVEETVVHDGKVGVVASGRVVPPSRIQTPSTESTTSEFASRVFDEERSTSSTVAADKCAVCEMVVSSRRDGTVGVCTHCDLIYHPHCYDGLVKRIGTDSKQADSSSWLDGEFTCDFCAKYTGRNVGVYLTWRANRAENQDALPCPLGSVDVLVKWIDFSFRHLHWVPFTWLQCTRRSSSGHLRNIRTAAQQGRTPWRLEDRFNRDFTKPVCIVDVRPAPSWLTKKRTKQLQKAEPIVEDSKWDFFTDYESVRVAWKGLGMSESTWETPPNPTVDIQEFLEWYGVFQVWKRVSAVSLLKHKRVETQRKMDRHDDISASQRLNVSRNSSFLRGERLMDYQVVGVNWLLKQWLHGQPAILADEMGMGKTIQVIAFLLAIYHSTLEAGLSGEEAVASNAGTFPFLVVVPTSLVGNWMNEFRKWAPELVVAQLSGGAEDRDVQLRHTIFRTDDAGKKDLCCHVLLASYEAASNSSGISSLMSSKFVWETVIVDEGQRLKNDQTKTYGALSRFHTRQCVVLTGTPLQNDVGELFSILRFMDPKRFGTVAEMKDRYPVNTTEGINRIKDVVRPYILRRTKNDQLALVPPKCELILPVSMSRLQRELYRATLSRNANLLHSIATALHASSAAAKELDALSNGNGIATDSEAEFLGPGKRGQGVKKPPPARPTRLASLTNILMEVRRIVSHPYLLRNVEPEFSTEEEGHRRLIDSSGKLQLLHMLLPEFKARGHRVLLFSQFKDTLTILEDYLTTESIAYLRIDGDTPSVERQTKVDRFNEPDSQFMVFLATTRIGGVGLNLTSADVVIIHDCDFNPQADIQAMARAHRIGQTKPVTVLKFVVHDSAEERILKSARRKLVLDHLIIQSMDNDIAVSDKPMELNDVELTLRHGASKLFESNADENAESQAIRYDHSRVSALLDKCESEQRAEAERIKQEAAKVSATSPSVKEFSNSTVSNFLRVWTLDATGTQMEELSDGPIDTPAANEDDIWSQLLESTTGSAEPENVIASEEIGGRSLRVRKRKVDYELSHGIEDGSAKKHRKPSQYDGGIIEDGDFVLDSARDSDNDDASVISDMSIVDHVPVLNPVVTVTINELIRLVEMNCERLCKFYIKKSVTEPPTNAMTAAKIGDILASVSRIVPDATGERYADPDLFFPIPSNMRLRKGASPPCQGTAKVCWACSAPQHSRSFCPRICDSAFIALIHKLTAIPEHWYTPLFFRFMHWYSYQYVWFMLSAPNGIAICERNRMEKRDNSVDANVYLQDIRFEQANTVRQQQQQQAVQMAPRLPPDLVSESSPYTIEVPSRVQQIRGVYSNLSMLLDEGAVSGFFSSMGATSSRFADLDKATDNVEGMRGKHKSLVALRTTCVRGMRGCLDSWLKRPHQADLTKVSHYALGLRFVAKAKTDINLALVDKLVLEQASGLAKREVDMMLQALFGMNKIAFPKGVHANIVRARQLLLLLLRIKTSKRTEGQSQVSKIPQLISVLLDEMSQYIITQLSESASPPAGMSGIGSSFSLLFKFVSDERQRRESYAASENVPPGSDGGYPLSGDEATARQQYKKRLSRRINNMFAQLKQMLAAPTLAGTLDGSAPDVATTSGSIGTSSIIDGGENRVPVMQAAPGAPLPYSHSVQAPPAVVSSTLSSASRSALPALERRSTVSGGSPVVPRSTTYTPPVVSSLSAQNLPRLARPVPINLAPLVKQTMSAEQPAPMVSATGAGPYILSPITSLGQSVIRPQQQQQQRVTPQLPFTSWPSGTNAQQVSASPAPIGPGFGRQQMQTPNGSVVSLVHSRTPSPSVDVRLATGISGGGNLIAVEPPRLEVNNVVVARQLGLSQMSPTNVQQPTTFPTEMATASSGIGSREIPAAATTLANIAPASELQRWQQRMLSPNPDTAQQQQQQGVRQVSRVYQHGITTPQQYHYHHQQQQLQNQLMQKYQHHQYQQQQYRMQQFLRLQQQQQQQQQQLYGPPIVDQQQLQALQHQFHQYMQQQNQPQFGTTTASGPTAVSLVMTPQTPVSLTSLITPLSTTTAVVNSPGGNRTASSTDKWDLACALCGELLHAPQSCANKEDIGKLTRRRVEVDMDMTLGATMKEMMLDTIDKYLKLAYKV
ncbi:hypothetical protein EV175_001970 [Coemansia sp. RSA 1933]|nr:hypothetical protein EV175_001970 [Coemansia sp. RSA 1933]